MGHDSREEFLQIFFFFQTPLQWAPLPDFPTRLFPLGVVFLISYPPSSVHVRREPPSCDIFIRWVPLLTRLETGNPFQHGKQNPATAPTTRSLQKKCDSPFPARSAVPSSSPFFSKKEGTGFLGLAVEIPPSHPAASRRESHRTMGTFLFIELVSRLVNPLDAFSRAAVMHSLIRRQAPGRYATLCLFFPR